MKSLYINTTEKFLSIAFKDENNFVHLKSNGEKSQSEEIFITIQKILENNKLSDLDFIVVLSGPGSFTGIRLGLSIVKGFNLAIKIPIISIDNFKASFLSIKEKFNSNIMITISATGQEIYFAKFDKNGNEISKPEIIKKENLFFDGKIFENIELNPEIILSNIEKKFDKKQFIQKDIKPTYIKPHYAKIKKS